MLDQFNTHQFRHGRSIKFQKGFKAPPHPPKRLCIKVHFSIFLKIWNSSIYSSQNYRIKWKNQLFKECFSVYKEKSICCFLPGDMQVRRLKRYPLRYRDRQQIIVMCRSRRGGGVRQSGPLFHLQNLIFLNLHYQFTKNMSQTPSTQPRHTQITPSGIFVWNHACW